MSKDIKPWCVLPWVHLSTRPNGRIRLCCRANSSAFYDGDARGGHRGVIQDINLSQDTLQEAWNHPYMRATRLEMLAGGIPKDCLGCKLDEQQGLTSKRQWENKKWCDNINMNQLWQSTRSDGSLDQPPVYLDLRLGNICNLKCSMCGPGDSSRWIKDWKEWRNSVTDPDIKSAMNWEENQDYHYNWPEDSDLSHQLEPLWPYMQELMFAGGEPLMSQQHHNIIRHLINTGGAKNIVLRYATNGTKITPEIIEQWSHFRQVWVGVSMDATHQRNHWIRWPTDWDTVAAALNLLDQSPNNINITINSTVQIMNVLHIPDFIQWRLEQPWSKIDPHGPITFHSLYHPRWLNIQALPRVIKQQVENVWRTRLPEMLTYEQCQRTLGFLEYMQASDSYKRQPLYMWLEAMSRNRDQDWRTVFPELHGVV